MPEKIDRRLNLILDAERADGSKVFIHHEPISRMVYENHFDFITSTMVRLYNSGYPPGTGVRVAMLSMKKHAKEMDASFTEDNRTPNQDNLEQNLLPEIWRMTNVAFASPTGWQTMPFQDAINKKLLDDDDIAEVQNYLCFFTSASWFHKTKELKGWLYPLLKKSVQVESSTFMAFVNSLPTLTTEETTGATGPA